MSITQLSITQQILKIAGQITKAQTVQAHCDVPCGIYDPHLAQIAALTTIRMIDLMQELQTTHSDHDLEFTNTLTRHIMVKENHAEICKQEIRIIWGDYFKAEHIEKFPELHDLTQEIMQLASKVRQGVNREHAVQLLDKVNRFAEIFWETKGITTKRAKAPYKPEAEVVYPNL